MIDIRKIRGKMGLTQEEFAKQCGLSRNTINSFEKNESDCLMIESAYKIAKFLDMSIFDFYGIDILKIKPKSADEFRKIIDILETELEKCH